MQLQGLRAVLTGEKGWVANERFILDEGVPTTVGRSRSCEVSLRRIASYLQKDPAERDADHDFNTVSRRHIRVTVKRAIAHIEDLSTNGTYYNNIQASGPIDLDLREGSIQIRLGTRETFRLHLEETTAERLRNGSLESSLMPDSLDEEQPSFDPLEAKEAP